MARIYGRAFAAEASKGEARRARRHERSYRGACPFTVHRTASDNLPVYVVKQKNRTEDVTVVRKLRGDSEALKKELEPLGASSAQRHSALEPRFLCQTRASYGKSGYLQLVRSLEAFKRF